MLYLQKKGSFYNIMAKSDGMLGDFSIKRLKSKRVAEEFCRRTNEMLVSTDKRAIEPVQY